MKFPISANWIRYVCYIITNVCFFHIKLSFNLKPVPDTVFQQFPYLDDYALKEEARSSKRIGELTLEKVTIYQMLKIA